MKRLQLSALFVFLIVGGAYSCSGDGAEDTSGVTLAPYVEPEPDSKGGPPVKPPVDEQDCCKVSKTSLYECGSVTPKGVDPQGKEDKGGATGDWNTTVDCDKPITADMLDDICKAKKAGKPVPPGAHDPVCKAYCKNCAPDLPVIDEFKTISDWEGILSGLLTALSISDTALEAEFLLNLATFVNLAGKIDWIENMGKGWGCLQCLKGIIGIYKAAKDLVSADSTLIDSYMEKMTKLYCALQGAAFACQTCGFPFLPSLEALFASSPHLAAVLIGAALGCAIGEPLSDVIKCNSFEPACAKAICAAQPIPLDSCCICGWVTGAGVTQAQQSMYAANKGDCEGKDLCKKDSNGNYVYSWAEGFCNNGTPVQCLWKEIDLDKSGGCLFCSVRYMVNYCSNDNRIICLTHKIYQAGADWPIDMPKNPCGSSLKCDEIMTPEEFEKLILDRPVCPPEPPPAVKPDCTAETEGEKWCENDLILECRVKEDGTYDWWGVYPCSGLRPGATCVDGKCVGGTPPGPECTDPEGTENNVICAEDKTGILSCQKNGGVYAWEEIQNCSFNQLVCDDTGGSPECVTAPTGDCNPPCGADESCVDGMCSPTSTDCDPPCNADETCMAGVCSPTLPSPTDCEPPCNADETCVDGMCSPTQTDCDPPCNADETCMAGVCTPTLPSPTDCDPPCTAAETCVDGGCVDNSGPPPPPQ